MENNVLTCARESISHNPCSLSRRCIQIRITLNRKQIHNCLYPLSPMHTNQNYPQPETDSQPPLPSLDDASKSELPSTGKISTFISLALQLPF